MGKKRATGATGINPAGTSSDKGMVAVSNGPTAVPSKPGNPRTGMGVKSGTSQAPGNKGGGVSGGRARTNRGKNSTCAGKQGLRG